MMCPREKRLCEAYRRPANKQSVMLAIVNGRTCVSEAFEMGANFVLGKPIQDGRICAVLDTAVPKMEREHRRYFRHPIDLPIEPVVHRAVLPGEDAEYQRGRLCHPH